MAPHLDAMASEGLRFDRFYAAAPVCSPTRASVLTDRSNDWTGVFHHGSPLRQQEKSLAQMLADAGHAASHFEKWHLDGLRGPGVPVLANDSHVPGAPSVFSTDLPASTVDMFPTLTEIIDLPDDSHLLPQDGTSLLPLIEGKQETRSPPRNSRKTIESRQD